MTSFNVAVAQQSNGTRSHLGVTQLPRTVFSATPVVTVVVDSEQGEYMGHFDLTPDGAAALANSLIEAANAAGQQKENN